MIPSVRSRIDQVNGAIGNHDNDNAGNRVPIPAAEIAELVQFRVGEHNRRAREEINARILEWEERKSRGDVADEQRPFGLPQEKEPSHIWEMIFDHVHDAEDVMNLRDTCVLFSDLLEMKYKTLRLAEVMVKFGTRLGGLSTLLGFRLVCKSTKAAIDNWISEYRLDQKWYRESIPFFRLREDQWMKKPTLHFPHYRYPMTDEGREEAEQLHALQAIVRSLELRSVPANATPIRILCLKQWLLQKDGNLAGLNNLWSLFQRFLELVGSSIRIFEYIPYRDNIENYNQLRTWVSLMPRLEELILVVQGNPRDPPALPIPPFPHSPTLKRIVNWGYGMRASFFEQILLANPRITDVLLTECAPENEADETLRRSLANLQLERFYLDGDSCIPRDQRLGLRFAWPLKYLTLKMRGLMEEEALEGFSSRTLFNFINSFRQTLEGLAVTWKLRDTGGFLDLPKVKKLLWRLWPTFMSLEFTVALEGLQHLDIDLHIIQRRNWSLETAKALINDMNLPPMFPALRQLRMRTQDLGDWIQVKRA